MICLFCAFLGSLASSFTICTMATILLSTLLLGSLLAMSNIISKETKGFGLYLFLIFLLRSSIAILKNNTNKDLIQNTSNSLPTLGLIGQYIASFGENNKSTTSEFL